MIERICFLLEVLSVVICLHHLYGEKFKLDIWTTSLISIDLIIMAIVKYYEISRVYTLIIYVVIIIYCGIKFGFNWKEIIVNNILYMIIVGGMQLIVIVCYGWIFNKFKLDMLTFENNEIFIANSGVLFFICTILPQFRIYKLSHYLQTKEGILIFALVFCIILTLCSLFYYKAIDGLKIFQSMILYLSIALFCILAGQLGKYKIKSKEIETELKMNKLFADSFNNLIEDIRQKQHEFDNHISVIYSLHYTCDTYEELVRAQNEYSHSIIKENRYNKLLKAGNPLLIGFLYGKFIEIEKYDIVLSYRIIIDDLKVDIPVYKLVEILGNLIKNAVEAIITSDYPKELYIAVLESGGEFEIEVRNRSEFINYNQIESFFKKGVSKKGKDRGLGLFNVKKICDEYSLKILCENKNFNDENWLCFTINNQGEDK